jgi:hypothetical protein
VVSYFASYSECPFAAQSPAFLIEFFVLFLRKWWDSILNRSRLLPCTSSMSSEIIFAYNLVKFVCLRNCH